jgi:hypothetical protein
MGGPLRERKFLHGQLKPAARRAGLPGTLRAHDLRHTAASLLTSQGASVKAVQKTLGHKSAVMTLDRYGHLWPDELEDLAERLDRARAAAVAAEASPHGGPDTQRSRSVTCSHGGGGETRTPVPQRRPRASPSAATG